MKSEALTPPKYDPFKTVAIWTGESEIFIGDTIKIPELSKYLEYWDSPNTNGFLTATDKGGGLGWKNGHKALDLFVGEDQPTGRNAYNDLMSCAQPTWENIPPGTWGCIVGGIPEYVDVYKKVP